MYDHVIWPLPFDPKTSAIYALDDIDVNAQPEVVWKLLVDAENWSSYFPAEDQVKILTGEPELELGTKNSRVTVGFRMHLIVTEYVPGRRLAWSTLVDGDETGSSAYHGWTITPTDTGCHLLSEETQQGSFFLEELGRKNPGALYRYHQEWIESLARAAEARAADAVKGDKIMAKTDIEKVLTIFHGISAGDVDVATQHIDRKRFVQHNPYATDGVEGLTQFINQSPRDQLQLTVVRAFRMAPTSLPMPRGSDPDETCSSTFSGLRTAWLLSAELSPPSALLPIRAGTLRPTGPLRQHSLRTQRRISRSSGNTTRPFMSQGITVKFRITFTEIIASATNPVLSMELRHSSVTSKNSRNTEA
jgi:uncharacterized protein YndB with AHSA1/START domain